MTTRGDPGKRNGGKENPLGPNFHEQENTTKKVRERAAVKVKEMKALGEG